MDEPSIPTASAGTAYSASSASVSQASRPVMIFVVLAMRLRVSASSSYRTRPLSASIKIALCARIDGSAARTGAIKKAAADKAAAVLRIFPFIFHHPRLACPQGMKSCVSPPSCGP